MIFPLTELLTENRELGLVVAVLIGFAFGFVLERAGFGRANKLAGQFYLHDMTVFKVMFGAVVTAMLGLMIAAGLGIADLKLISETAASQTYLWPMLVGGLMLGAGFIISGYCPGTSLVASASGNIDGMVAFGGVIVGSFVYSELFPLLEPFHLSGAQGHLFLYQLLDVPPSLLAAGVALMAIGCFFGADKLEKIFSVKRQGIQPIRAPRGFAFATMGMAALLAVGTLFFPVARATATKKDAGRIQPAGLARRLIEQPWKIRVLDVRREESCMKQRVPGAECAPLATLGELGLAYSPRTRDLVLVASADNLKKAPRAASGFTGDIYILAGGFQAWRKYALKPPATPTADATPEQLEAHRIQAAVHRSLTGARAAPPPPRKAVKYQPKKRRKTGGCG